MLVRRLIFVSYSILTFSFNSRTILHVFGFDRFTISVNARRAEKNLQKSAEETTNSHLYLIWKRFYFIFICI